MVGVVTSTILDLIIHPSIYSRMKKHEFRTTDYPGLSDL
jgi:hypothetical protein